MKLYRIVLLSDLIEPVGTFPLCPPVFVAFPFSGRSEQLRDKVDLKNYEAATEESGTQSSCLCHTNLTI